MDSQFVWTPTSEVAEQTNVLQFARALGLRNVQELIDRSLNDIEWFWESVVNQLPLDFFELYDSVLDSSQGIPWSRWFVGGKLNIAYNCVDRHAELRGGKTALIWEGEDGATRSLTYSELLAETNRAANALKSLGVACGDRVGLLLPMIPEVVIAFLAIAKIGAIALPIFSGFGASAVAARLNDAEAKVLITTDGFLRKGHQIGLKNVADEAAAQAPSVKHVLIVSRLDVDVAVNSSRDRRWEEITKGASDDCSCESMDSEDPFLIIYTSGTTGKPKGAVHVHGGFLVKIAQEVAHQADLQDHDRLFWFTDMGWIMGPWEVVGGLALGGTIVLYEGAPDWPDPARLWKIIEKHRVSILGVSPTLVRALMKHGDTFVNQHDLSSLRVLGSTGEPWNPEPWRWYFENVGKKRCPVINFSGGTEVGACFLSALPCHPIKPCSLGGPSLGMAVDVFDHDGQPLRGGVGELVCTKPWPGMTRGFWKSPERFLETYWSRWPDVWAHGDWASIDEDGQWFLHGRSDDTLKVAGKRLGPAEIESVLVSHTGVAEAAAIGVPDEVKGEAVWCFVTLKRGVIGDAPLAQALRDLVIDALGKSFSPSRIDFIAELPRTRSAKIVRRAIRAAALGLDPGDLTGLENPEAIRAIAELIADS